jgi:TPR repeat protein
VKLLTPAATAEAVAELYRRAAVQGHPSGQLALGRCYLSGEGVQRCNRRAIEWLERAAAQGADDNVAAAWAADELAALTRDADEPVK